MNMEVTFKEEDMKDVTIPHDDLLVITSVLKKDEYTTVRLHKGGSVDVLY